ncbi:MAG: triose-phosphate isomerase [Proteobacteria bacterium]|nr:triose-phosphate isomerase [Pseudomonadota bacterium]MBU1059722.1 triose-phosphate isomerase [Pseudomonadota bacterium]
MIGNWKCNKGESAAEDWFAEFAALYRPVAGLQVVVAPSLLCLLPLSRFVRALQLKNVSLAAQDVSPFPKGSYTGAVAADMLKGLVEYVIIGHSERRRYFHETPQDIANKLAESVDAGLKPIVCLDQPYPMSQLMALTEIECEEMIIAYSPTEGTVARVPEEPQRVAEAVKSIAQVHPKRPVIYGGSLFPDNVTSYISLPQLSGLFVGESSLDAQSFVAICNKVRASLKEVDGQ